MTRGDRPKKKNIESLKLTQKVNLLRLWGGNKLTLVSPGWIGSVSSALSSALDSNTLAGLK